MWVKVGGKMYAPFWVPSFPLFFLSSANKKMATLAFSLKALPLISPSEKCKCFLTMVGSHRDVFQVNSFLLFKVEETFIYRQSSEARLGLFSWPAHNNDFEWMMRAISSSGTCIRIQDEWCTSLKSDFGWVVYIGSLIIGHAQGSLFPPLFCFVFLSVGTQGQFMCVSKE